VTTDVVIHEVTETTHLKLSHGDTSGVTSFLLTTETVRSGTGEGKCGEERPKASTDPANLSEPKDELLSQLKEVRQSEDGMQDGSRYCYHQHITRQAVKGIL
jgi:hypothetical protein